MAEKPGFPESGEIATWCARPLAEEPGKTQALAPAIEPSVVYRVADLDQVDAIYERRELGYIYSRDGHPGATELARKLAGLEGAEAGLVTAAGMSAESALFLQQLSAGRHVVLADGLYGKTVKLFEAYLSRFGVSHSSFDPTRAETLPPALRDETALVFVETISNPLLRLADLPGISRVLSQRPEILLAVDNTFAPVICRPLAWGAHAVTHSLTKLVGGHSDLMLGLLAGSRQVVEGAAAASSAFGMNGSPFDCWLALRGLASLPLRSERVCRTALSLAERLAGDARLRAVHYPGLKSHPDQARASQLLSGGFGGIVTIDLGTRERANALIRGLEGIPFAPSLGDVTTTLSHPATTSHRGQTAEQWARQGITPGLVRLSVGLEDADSLWEELRAGLEQVG